MILRWLTPAWLRRLLWRWLLRPALQLLTLLALTAAGLAWHTLPGGDLNQTIPDLTAKVDITLDDDGIPRIQARTETDAAAALGFLHARERLFQMDLTRRAARGELSELVGPATLRLDRLNRTLGLKQAAEADLEGLQPETRAILDAYARGVNAWIARRGRFSALEFVVLGTPRPWTAADSLLWGKLMGLYLSANWRTELARLQLEATLSPAEIRALWPEEITPGPEAAITPKAALHLHTENLPHFPDAFTLPPSASNAWAVDGAHSTTGHPLLAGDPHLNFSLPAIWYLARIDLPDHSLVGATAPGLPFLVLGHNGHIAWSFTTTGADVQDLFIETPQDGGVATEHGPAPFTTRTETIHIRGQKDETLTIRSTRHGPVISDLVGEPDHIISVQMANLAPGDTSADGILALNRARTVADAEAAAPRLSSPVQNLIVADTTTIGFFVTGRIPIRTSGHGDFPANGADGSGDWIGWASGSQLPHSIAPTSGRLVNANNRVAPPDFPVFLGADWFGDTRARRIRQMLDSHPKASPDDFTAMQTDDLDLIATDILPRLTPLAPELAGWDGRMREDQTQPTLYNAWMVAFFQEILNAHHVPAAATDAAEYWPDLIHHSLSPGGETLCNGDCTPLLRLSLQTARASLTQRLGADPSTWQWGKIHTLSFAPPALRAISILGPLATTTISTPGSNTTVGRGGFSPQTFAMIHGAAFRGIYDLANLDQSRFTITPGQSGTPLSPLATNFIQHWQTNHPIQIGPNPTHAAVHISLDP